MAAKIIAWCLSGKTGVLWIGSSPSSICRDSPHLLQRFQLENDRFVLSNKNQLLLKICCSSLPSSSLLKSSLLFVSAPRNKSDCKTSEPEKFFQKVFRFKTPRTYTKLINQLGAMLSGFKPLDLHRNLCLSEAVRTSFLVSDLFRSDFLHWSNFSSTIFPSDNFF